MRPLVAAIVATVRQALPELDTGSPLVDLEDDDLAHVIFFSYRAEPKFGYGMRLSREGYQLLASCFQHYEINLTDDTGARELLYLNRASPYPYFVSRESIVLFDYVMAVHLRLAGGSLRQLRESEEFWSRSI